MNIITVDQLALMAGVAPNANMRSVAVSLNQFGPRLGITVWRLAHYLAQLMHESGAFRYDEEIASGRAYEGRKDLGNTEPGDGERFKGRTGIQLTGRANYRQFYRWAKKMFPDVAVPDFEAHPELVNTDPWEGLAPLFYLTTRKLNALADENDLEQITKKVNGALKGLEDRITRYIRVALVLNGYGPKDVLAFQTWAQQQGFLPQDKPGEPTQRDGDPGPKTRGALHMALVKKGEALDGPIIDGIATEVLKPSPVTTEVEVEKEVAVAVVPAGSTKRGVPWLLGSVPILGGVFTWFFDLDRVAQITIGSGTALFVLLLLFRGELIIRRIKSLVAEVNT
jgi:putative chitinase